MLVLCPEEAFHADITSAAVLCPAAMFSALLVLYVYPLADMRVHGEALAANQSDLTL